MPQLEPETLYCKVKHSGQRDLLHNKEDRCGYVNEPWITRVAETSDNDLRAHRIAMSYHHYGLELDALIHGDRSMEQTVARPPTSSPPPLPNANWFSFATWGTLTATQNITNDRAPQRLNSGIAAPLRRRLTPAILRAKAADGQEVGRALAWAQRLVFVSTACGLLHLSSQVISGQRQPFEGSEAHGILKRLAMSADPGAPKTDLNYFTDDRHLPPLVRAFDLYRAAADAKGASRIRARLIFGANVALTAVEQDLLDPALSFVVGLIPRRIEEGVDWRIARIVERVRGVPPAITFSGMQLVPRPERRTADLAWSRFMTDQVLVMALPTETLRVGRDVPQWRRNRSYFPADLADLTPPSGPADPYKAELNEVFSHVQSLDRTIGDGRGSAARDWRRWDERLNWAITLMRTRQNDESLYWTPYSVDDEWRIAHGKLPHRSGDPSWLEVQPPLDPTIFTRADLESENYR